MSGFGGAVRRAVRHHPYAAELAVATAAFAAMLVTTPLSRVSLAAALTAVVPCGALWWRRSRPFAVLAVSTVGAAVYSAMTVSHGFTLAAPLVALYTAAETTGRRRALTIGWLSVLVFAALHAVLRPVKALDWQNLAVIALGGLAVAAGDAARSHRAYVAQVEERARRAERDREREARRRVTEERLRIARELHDVVGHHLALINVQAGVAAHVLADRPDQAVQALANIRQACRAGLDELRDTIGLLREPGEPAAPTEPAVGLSGLDELIASFARSGMRIERDVGGTVRVLPTAADLTAYRVVQESLTNVRKHADGAATRLRLDYDTARLRIMVEDDGPVRPAPGDPHGTDDRAHGTDAQGTDDGAREDRGGREGGAARHCGGGHKGAGAREGDGGYEGVGRYEGAGAREGDGGYGNGGGQDNRGGHGIAGMRERLAVVGGSLEAGPRPGGGFRVSAELPLPGSGWS